MFSHSKSCDVCVKGETRQECVMCGRWVCANCHGELVLRGYCGGIRFSERVCSKRCARRARRERRVRRERYWGSGVWEVTGDDWWDEEVYWRRLNGGESSEN